MIKKLVIYIINSAPMCSIIGIIKCAYYYPSFKRIAFPTPLCDSFVLILKNYLYTFNKNNKLFL